MANNIQWNNVAAPEMNNKGILGAGTLFKSSLGDIAKSLEAESQRRKSIVSKDIENQLLNAKDDAQLQAIQQQVASPDNPYRQYVDPLELTKGLQSRSQAIKDKAIADMEYSLKKKQTSGDLGRIGKIEKVKDLNADQAVLTTDKKNKAELSALNLAEKLRPQKEAEAIAMSKLDKETLDNRVRTKKAQTNLAELVSTNAFKTYPETQRRAIQDLYYKDIDNAFKIAEDNASRVTEEADKIAAQNTINTMKSMLRDTNNTEFLNLIKANGGINSVANSLAAGITPESSYLKWQELDLPPRLKTIFTMMKNWQAEQKLINPNQQVQPNTIPTPFGIR